MVSKSYFRGTWNNEISALIGTNFVLVSAEFFFFELEILSRIIF